MPNIRSILQLTRPHQLSKNILIFLPIFFGTKIDQTNLLINCTIAFIGFSFITSAIYIFNDLSDINEDSLHPTKKNRPLASSLINKSTAWILLSVFFVTGISIFSFALNNWVVIKIVLFYFTLNIMYSLWLKHIVILDITIIAIGFVIRLFIGGILTETKLSHWMVIMTFLLAFFLALSKRRGDVLIYNSTLLKSRKNIDGYNLAFLNISMIVSAAVIIVSYLLYTVSVSTNIQNAYNEYLYLTTLFVLLGIMRYFQLITVLNKTGDPTTILYKDESY